ncbi:hypothetical protein [Roseicyclus mahoneyensis]|uniref:hypothetical protein n=1 Tax=Roseicyclus mahoneyensis TaxID=164332 RepID=UPI0011B21D1B|nr:hypothetical protein [Roseicyclus mahoneyensis]
MEHEAALNAQGIGRVSALRNGYNDNFAGFYMGMPKQWSKIRILPAFQGLDPDQAQSRLRDIFLAEARVFGHEKMLITFEGLLPRQKHEIDRFMALCHEVTSNVWAVVAIRRQDRWALSSYNTRLVGEVPISENPLESTRQGRLEHPEPAGMHYATCLSHWAKHIPREKLAVLAYEDHPNMLAAYFAAIGFVADTRIEDRRNTGMSAYGQQVLRLAGMRELERGRPLGEIKRLQRLLKGIVPRGEGRRPSAAQAAAHLAHFAKDHERLRGDWLPETSKFFEDDAPYPDEATVVQIADDELEEWIAKAEKFGPDRIDRDGGIVTPGTAAWHRLEAISRGTLSAIS